MDPVQVGRKPQGKLGTRLVNREGIQLEGKQAMATDKDRGELPPTAFEEASRVFYASPFAKDLGLVLERLAVGE